MLWVDDPKPSTMGPDDIKEEVDILKNHYVTCSARF